jgi:xylulokinase
VIDDGMSVDGLGTVECVTVGLNQPTTDKRLLAGKIPCFPHVVDGMYAVIGYNYTGGILLRWFRDNFCAAEVEEARRRNVDPYELITAQAAAGPSSVLILTHFTGAGTPYLDADSKGAIIGLTLATKKADLIKAIIDSVTYEIALNIEMMANAGIVIKELRATGGGAKSKLWLQTKADITGLPVLTLNVSEGGCLATAMLAGVGVGKFKSIREAARQLVHVKDRCEPNPALHKQYREMYELHKRLYPAISPISHRIGATAAGK